MSILFCYSVEIYQRLFADNFFTCTVKTMTFICNITSPQMVTVGQLTDQEV